MNNFRYFPLLLASSLGVWTAPAFSLGGSYEQTAPQQRRSDLRLALMEPVPREGQSQERVRDDGAAVRHLSDEERANLREQLRQQLRAQRQDGRPTRP